MGINLKTTTGKIVASVALVGTAAGVAGLGTYGAFSSTTSASQTVSSGTVTIALGTGSANTLNVPVTGVLPGDRVEKLVTLANTGTSDLNNVTLSTSAGTTGSLLTSDVTNGLHVKIENCSTAWAGTAGAYTCAPGSTVVLATSPILTVTPTALANLTSLTSGKTDNLKVTTSLPDTANNDFQTLSSTVGFDFTGTQRTATSK